MREILSKIVGKEQFFENEPMKDHTTFRVGGNARYYVKPTTVESLRQVLAACRERQMPYFVIGNGSNLLVSDQGYEGVIIQLFKNMSAVTQEGSCLRVQAGALLSKTAAKALEAGLTGMEFASGIPGTIGGAVVMNAGAYGGEMKDILKEAAVLTPEGQVLILKKEELELGYRTSVVAKRSYLVLEAVLELREGDRAQIKARMEELKEARISKQPLEYPSAGSTFKRPAGYFAGKLIMDSGLAGYRVGGAMVSEKHCGFVINYDHATAADILQVIRHVQQIVEEKYQVRLETEVKLLGFSEK